MAESEEELKHLLMKVKEESEKAGEPRPEASTELPMLSGTSQDLPYPITAAVSSTDSKKASYCYIQAEARETRRGLGQVASQLFCQLGLPL